MLKINTKELDEIIDRLTTVRNLMKEINDLQEKWAKDQPWPKDPPYMPPYIPTVEQIPTPYFPSWTTGSPPKIDPTKIIS